MGGGGRDREHGGGEKSDATERWMRKDRKIKKRRKVR